jgi:hypothetical protein
MNISFQIKQGILHATQFGDFEPEVYLHGVAEAMKLDGYVPGMSVIADARLMLKSSTPEEMMRLRDGLNEGVLRAFRPRRYAIVTTMPMYEMIVKLFDHLIADALEGDAPKIQIRCFATPEEAEIWIRSA